jgi:hypothetical protein
VPGGSRRRSSTPSGRALGSGRAAPEAAGTPRSSPPSSPLRDGRWLSVAAARSVDALDEIVQQPGVKFLGGNSEGCAGAAAKTDARQLAGADLAAHDLVGAAQELGDLADAQELGFHVSDAMLSNHTTTIRQTYILAQAYAPPRCPSSRTAPSCSVPEAGSPPAGVCGATRASAARGSGRERLSLSSRAQSPLSGRGCPAVRLRRADRRDERRARPALLQVRALRALGKSPAEATSRGTHRGTHATRIPGIAGTHDPLNHAVSAKPCGAQRRIGDSNPCFCACGRWPEGPLVNAYRAFERRPKSLRAEAPGHFWPEK